MYEFLHWAKFCSLEVKNGQLDRFMAIKKVLEKIGAFLSSASESEFHRGRSAATTIMLRALTSNRADHVSACNMAEWR